MPMEVHATSDDAFIVEVSQTMLQRCALLQSDVSEMLEIYLRRREREMKEQLSHELAQARSELHEEMEAELQRRLEPTNSALARNRGILSNMVARWAAQQEQRQVHHAYASWVSFARRRHQQRAQLAFLRREAEVRLRAKAWIAFRALLSAKKCREQCAQLRTSFSSHEKELVSQIEHGQLLLVEEQKKSKDLQENLRQSFVKGVSAINREAMQVLRGPDDEDHSAGDVATIEQILTKDTNHYTELARHESAHASSQPSRGAKECSARHASSICPVHQVDDEGYWHHRCFAPGQCPHGMTSSPPRGPHQPFVVRADPANTRSYQAGPQLQPSSFGRRTR